VSDDETSKPRLQIRSSSGALFDVWAVFRANDSILAAVTPAGEPCVPRWDIRIVDFLAFTVDERRMGDNTIYDQSGD